MSGELVERRLGWVTVDGQRYPREKASDWLDAIQKGLCPFCGAGPFTVVALHVTSMHGIDKRELRDLLRLPNHKPICSKEYSQAKRAKAIRQFEANPEHRRRFVEARGTDRISEAKREAWRRLRKIHPCNVCGTDTGTVKRKTCSDACLQEAIRLRGVKGGNATATRRTVEMTTFTCPMCGQEASKRAKIVNFNQGKKGSAGPFCGRSCAARHNTLRRLSLADPEAMP